MIFIICKKAYLYFFIGKTAPQIADLRYLVYLAVKRYYRLFAYLLSKR